MPQPTVYVRSYDFTGYQEQFPNQPLPAAPLDVNLDNISISIGQTVGRLGLIQRDDGALKTQSVGVDQLTNDVRALFGSDLNPRGAWVTLTDYQKLDLVTVNGVTYIAVIDHTSGASFSTDLAAFKWILFSNPVADSGTSFFQKFSGNGVQTVFTLSGDLGTDEKALLVFYDAGGTEGFQPLAPTAFTVNGTALTITPAPILATDNIFVFAPSELLGAIAAAQAAAEAAAAAAAQSAIDAAAAAASISALSSFYQNGSGNISFKRPASVTTGINFDVNGVLGVASGTVGAPSMTFNSDIDTGIYLNNTNTVGIAGAGCVVAIFNNSAGAVNYHNFSGSSSGNSVIHNVSGTDTNISILRSTKGTGVHDFYTNNGAQLQVKIEHIASAVNYLRLGGNSTGAAPYLTVGGADADIDLQMFSKGNGSVRIYSAGSGGISFYTDNTFSTTAFNITRVASSVNYLQTAGAATAATPSLVTAGGDTNIGMNISTKGNGVIGLYTANIARKQMEIMNVATTVNYWQFGGSATTAAIQVNAAGTDTNININITPKGTGTLVSTSFSPSSSNIPSNGMYLPTTNTVGIAAGGADALRVAKVGGTVVNWVEVSGNTSLSTQGVQIYSNGSDANINLAISSKGSGQLNFQTNFGAATHLVIAAGATAVNYLTISGSASGSGSATIGTAGTDANIDILVSPKGTGRVRYNNSVANGAVATTVTSLGPTGSATTIQGWLAIKDSAGNNRWVPYW